MLERLRDGAARKWQGFSRMRKLWVISAAYAFGQLKKILGTADGKDEDSIVWPENRRDKYYLVAVSLMAKNAFDNQPNIKESAQQYIAAYRYFTPDLSYDLNGAKVDTAKINMAVLQQKYLGTP